MSPTSGLLPAAKETIERCLDPGVLILGRLFHFENPLEGDGV
jgi:hypothetical protein